MQTNFLTKEGYQKMQEELVYLRKQKRQEVADRLHEAMEGGELIENAEYEAAKNEQAFVEGRIQELEMLLATARVIEDSDKKKKDTVQVGTTVTSIPLKKEPARPPWACNRFPTRVRLLPGSINPDRVRPMANRR